MPPNLGGAIPCEIRSERVRRAISEVFAAIQRHPRDWARLCRRVQQIGWLPETDDTTVGQWCVDREHVVQLCTETEQNPRLWPRQGTETFLARGWIGLARRAARLPADHLRAIVAHECGHSVTRARDVEVRARRSPVEGWASELSADMYAFRWGFEREVRAQQPSRPPAHHAVLPGEIIWDDNTAYRVDRRFFLRRCSQKDGARESAPPRRLAP